MIKKRGPRLGPGGSEVQLRLGRWSGLSTVVAEKWGDPMVGNPTMKVCKVSLLWLFGGTLVGTTITMIVGYSLWWDVMMRMNIPDTLSSGLDPIPIDQIFCKVCVCIWPAYLVDVASFLIPVHFQLQYRQSSGCFRGHRILRALGLWLFVQRTWICVRKWNPRISQ